MSHRPFRFVHATNLRLDQPLWGIGEVDPDVRRLAEDATLIALERMFDACVDRDVQFLLLTGNCFDTAAISLRAQTALEDGFEQLASHGIDVFLIPGETDAADRWHDNVRLPSNVTTFFGTSSDPVSVLRDGQVLATIEPLGDATSERDEHRGTFRIGLLPAGRHHEWQQRLRTEHSEHEQRMSDTLLKQRPAAAQVQYLALGSGESRLTLELPRGLAHDPGSPQSLEARGRGSHGCSLIEVDAHGRADIQLVPTAIIRWEPFTMPFDARDSWDDLAQRMQQALQSCEPAHGEKVWIVRWTLEGTGPLIDAMDELGSQQELCELIDQELTGLRGLRRVHQMEVRQAWQPVLAADTSESLFDEFMRYVQTDLAERLEQLRRGGRDGAWPAESWVQPLQSAAARVETANVLEQARNHGRVWLTGIADNDVVFRDGDGD